ncbi:MAG: hypothetical protein K2K44_08835 [Oscillospiraceae bacterium]|nr:hypothetical protein [Oscillospiraceae bacterium]
MTLEERSRAKKLEKLLTDYGKIIMTRRGVMRVIIIIMAFMYLLWFLVDRGEYIPSAHVFFTVIIMGVCNDDNVGDGGAPQGIDIGFPAIGSLGMGTFFCTLPFRAKDILNMRLRRFEINLAFINIVALINQVLFISMYGGMFPSGYCIALVLLSEIIYMVTMFIRNYKIKLYSNLSLVAVFVILSCPAFIDDTEAYQEILPLMKAFHFMDGWVGAAALIIIPILILTAGEIYLKNKKDPSWNLR